MGWLASSGKRGRDVGISAGSGGHGAPTEPEGTSVFLKCQKERVSGEGTPAPSKEAGPREAWLVRMSLFETLKKYIFY